MPVGWYLMPYRALDMGDARDARALAINFDQAVLDAFHAEDARLREAPCLGNHAVVKVRGSAGLLQAIAHLPGTDRFPKDLIDAPLSDLTAGQKTALRDRITGLGYTLAEFNAALGPDIGSRTLRDVVRFIVSKNQQQFTVGADKTTITMTGPVDAQDGPVLIDRLDAGV